MLSLLITWIGGTWSLSKPPFSSLRSDHRLARLDYNFQQWRAIPVDTLDQAKKIANRIVKKELQRGYHIYSVLAPDN